MDTETEQKLPEGATYGQPSAAQNASATADKKLPPGAQYGAPTSSERKLPQGARYGEARDNSTDSTSPIPENYGFTPRHMAGAAWEGLGNIASAGLEAGKDVLSYAFSPKPLLISDDKHGESLFHKYITAPAEAEKQKASTAPTALESIGHSVAEAIPVIGPIAAHIAERAGTGDVGGAAAEGITYAVAPKVAEKIVPPIVKGTLKR